MVKSKHYQHFCLCFNSHQYFALCYNYLKHVVMAIVSGFVRPSSSIILNRENN